jgi:glycosyltransferase involved in cell wall biosynthesis
LDVYLAVEKRFQSSDENSSFKMTESETTAEMAVAVTIILPTYNRARFLPEAFEAIRKQQFAHWELIVVDDGSTDNTRELVEEFARTIAQPVRYIYQENQGASGARNTGLDHATGKYIAFYDSDDVWLPHHLTDCVTALAANPDVDWVYGACRIVEESTDHVIAPNTFMDGAQRRPFLQLQVHQSGNLRILSDPALGTCLIEYGIMCGLQNSVIRGTVFQSLRIPPFRIGEDRLLPVFAIHNGCRFGYLDNVHVLYRVHDSNTSGASNAVGWEKQLNNIWELISAYEYLLQTPILTRTERHSLRRRLKLECFWHAGYAILWNAGRRKEAIQLFRRGLRYWPWDWRCWKTYFAARVRTSLLGAAKAVNQ